MSDNGAIREVVRSVVGEIKPLDAEEISHQQDVLAWIDSGEPIFRTEKPATPPKHLVSYCVLVNSDARRVLLVDHRDARLWLPTGGHVDPQEHPQDAARREIHEELGVERTFHAGSGGAPIMVTVTETGGVSAGHTDVSLWFAFEGSEADSLYPDEGEFVEVRWWDFDAVTHAPGTRFDPNLSRFLSKLDQY